MPFSVFPPCPIRLQDIFPPFTFYTSAPRVDTSHTSAMTFDARFCQLGVILLHSSIIKNKTKNTMFLSETKNCSGGLLD